VLRLSAPIVTCSISNYLPPHHSIGQGDHDPVFRPPAQIRRLLFSAAASALDHRSPIITTAGCVANSMCPVANQATPHQAAERIAPLGKSGSSLTQSAARITPLHCTGKISVANPPENNQLKLPLLPHLSPSSHLWHTLPRAVHPRPSRSPTVWLIGTLDLEYPKKRQTLWPILREPGRDISPLRRSRGYSCKQRSGRTFATRSEKSVKAIRTSTTVVQSTCGNPI
jgi:hypothetical protein